MIGAPRLRVALVALLLVVGPLSSTASAETGGGGGEWLPSLRVVGGLTIYPEAEGPSGVFGLTAGARLQLGEDGWSGLGVSGEVGWNYYAGSLPEANYLTVTLGADIGGRIVQLGVFGTLLVGESADDLAIGGRASLRGELLWGVFGLEVGYEAVELTGVLYHGVHVSAALDVGVLFFYAFGLTSMFT